MGPLYQLGEGVTCVDQPKEKCKDPSTKLVSEANHDKTTAVESHIKKGSIGRSPCVFVSTICSESLPSDRLPERHTPGCPI